MGREHWLPGSVSPCPRPWPWSCSHLAAAQHQDGGVSRTTRAVLLTLCGLLLVALPALAAWSDSYLSSALASFCQAGSLVLCGGHVVLPMLQASVVPVGWGATMPSCQAMAPRRLCRGPCSALRIFWVLSCHRRQGADLVSSLCWPPSSYLLSCWWPVPCLNGKACVCAMASSGRLRVSMPPWSAFWARRCTTRCGPAPSIPPPMWRWSWLRTACWCSVGCSRW